MDHATAQFAQLRDLIGDDAFRLLCAKFKGKRLYVPKEIGESHPISAAIGHTAAKMVSEQFGGERLEELPRPYSRRRLIVELSRRNVPVEEIRAQADCSRRRVRQVRAEIRAEADSPQPSLFPDQDEH